MIYLIDDRKHRQEEGGWSSVKFSEYSEYITPIYNYLELSNLSNEIYSSGNIVLFHESFIDKSSRANDSLIKDFETMLKNEVKKDDNFKLVYFSGSKKFRNLKDEIGYLPVEIVYQNLAVFITKIEEGIIDLKYLLYGNNHQIEETLYKQLRLKNDTIEDFQVDDDTTVNFVAKSLDEEIDDPFTNAVNEIIFGDEISDEYLNEIIIEWFSENEYDNLFIPLCFGPTLSDYNGLRLATHIRCTDTKNQLKPIFIYSFVDHSYLIKNEYFDVLKTKNVFLINYSKKSFQDAIDTIIPCLKIDEIPTEIRKINLSVPSNFDDNHSVSNEWSIYKWTYTLPKAFYKDVEKVLNNFEFNLYFKYLQTIYPISNIETIKLDELQTSKKYQNSRILYIDNDHEKGWGSLLKYILNEVNHFQFETLEIDFKKLSKEEIINQAYDKVISNSRINYDTIMLDFRLHAEDATELNLEFISGMQILKKIKQYNPGIQVLIFSATNKIWNLQALLQEGANGFIIKEGPENSIDLGFTKQSITNFLSLTEDCSKRSFLKSFFNTCDKIKQNISSSYSDDQTPFDDFKKELIISLKIIYESVYKNDLKLNSSLDIVFLNCYNFLEKFKHFYVKEANYKLVLGFEEVEMNRYNFNNGLVNNGPFIRNNTNDNPSFFHSITAILIDYFEVADSENNVIEKIYEIKESRNDYIHNDKSNFDTSELIDIINICKITTDNLKD